MNIRGKGFVAYAAICICTGVRGHLEAIAMRELLIRLKQHNFYTVLDVA